MNPATLLPELMKRHPAAFRLHSSPPRAQGELKARGAACEQSTKCFCEGLDSTAHGAILGERWAFDSIPEHLCFDIGEAASAAGERQA
jgi:hypothetical protein